MSFVTSFETSTAQNVSFSVMNSGPMGHLIPLGKFRVTRSRCANYNWPILREEKKLGNKGPSVTLSLRSFHVRRPIFLGPRTGSGSPQKSQVKDRIERKSPGFWRGFDCPVFYEFFGFSHPLFSRPRHLIMYFHIVFLSVAALGFANYVFQKLRERYFSGKLKFICKLWNGVA